ncbi:MAG: type IV toxin-antitoxin system AbiEi family antitoxin [Verrucomicrobiota bacterium]|nr:type IV toxin-antitoxin system AbiEi family antitoxin [Verrucomicrobiota bacterium]
MIRRAESPRVVRRMGAAEMFIESQLAVGRVAFPLSHLIGETGLSKIAANRQLSRLGPKVVKISERQSFYLIVSPEHRSFGAPPATWWLQEYFDWLERPYYLALQSAASVFGSNPQALQVTQVMTDSPRREISVGRIQVRFFVKRGIRRTATQQPSGAVAPLRVSTAEATVFDLIRYASSIGGIERAAETIAPLLGLLRPEELKRVLETENEITIAQRLGFILDSLGGKNLAKIVREWLPRNIRRISLSQIPEGGGEVPVNERWQILNTSAELNLLTLLPG